MSPARYSVPAISRSKPRLYPLGSVVMAVALLLSASLMAQDAAAPITLPQAVSMALEKNPLHQAALAGTRISLAGIRLARSPLMPKIMFSESAVRGNDPVFVFGTQLRQQSFTLADFALNRLNTPTPIGNFSSRFSGQWNLFDGLQSWYGVTRAKYMQQASEQQLDRTDQELVYEAVQAYDGVLLAQKQVAVSQATLKTAAAIEAQSRVRVESGMAVDSDLLSAQVATASRKQELIEAQNALALARSQLAIALGMPSDTVYQPQENLAEHSFPAITVAGLEQQALVKRPDLKQVESERSAQAKSISMAKGAFAPRLNVYGSWETDSPSPGWNGGNNWMAGAEVQFDLFDGDSKRAHLARRKPYRKRRRLCATLFAIRYGCKSAKLITTTTPPGSRSRWRATQFSRQKKACASIRTGMTAD